MIFIKRLLVVKKVFQSMHPSSGTQWKQLLLLLEPADC